MTDTFSDLETPHGEVLIEVLGRIAPSVLAQLLATSEPTSAERLLVADLVSSEFCRHLQPNFEPTVYGASIDAALGKFLLRWPVRRER